ncbi:8973_t:CDS:2 [Funneliformis geosporum]|uniref:12_t:CDS:1 n=1 Tax=Funneliformis geosporum TaxID=1117311 RepID=A0A9W4WRX9_9GLOM|nr:8973_t:CDS:2 [Funneliformis geosporum]CAI2167603.1 12_t:CDS:2 [Funneliformis geosporum]
MTIKISLLLIFTLASLCFVSFVKADREQQFDYDKNVLLSTVIGTKTEQPKLDLPKNLTIPHDDKFKFLLYARGYQIYNCKVDKDHVGTWILATPDAYLINEETETFTPNYQVSHHFFLEEPINEGIATWVSIIPGDESGVTTKVLATNEAPNDPTKNIPWLLTEATANYGDYGAFHDITYLLRVNTRNGVAPPNESCGTTYKNGTFHYSEYDSEYWFYH